MSSLPHTQPRPDYYYLALEMAVRFGTETFPVEWKDPVKVGFAPYKWGQNALGKPGVHDILAWLNPRVTGYAITPVKGSLLAFLDVDEPDQIPGLAFLPFGDTFTVRRGNHRHYYFYLAQAMPGASYKYSHLDFHGNRMKGEIASLRGAGAYVVGPGSRHESGDMYEIANNADPVHLSAGQTDKLFAFFNIRMAKQEPGLPSAAAPRSLPAPETDRSHQVESRTNPRLVDEIIRRLEEREGRTLNFSPSGTASLFKNPIRPDDEHRSSYFSRVTGWIHDRAGQPMQTADVCNLLGIRMTDYGGLYAQESVATESPTVVIPPVDEPAKPPRTAWAQGLPDELRTLLLNIDNETGLSSQAPATLVYDLYCTAVNRRVLADGKGLTISMLVEAAQNLNWQTTEWTVDKGITQLLAWGIIRDVTDDSGGYEKGETVLPQRQENSRGRPARVYRFRRVKVAVRSILKKVDYRLHEYCFGGITGKEEAVPDEPVAEWWPDDSYAAQKAEFVAKIELTEDQWTKHQLALRRYENARRKKQNQFHPLRLSEAVSTPLPADRTIKNATEYVDAYYLGKVRANPGRQISRAEAAKELGRAEQTLSAATKRAGVVRVPEYKVFEIVAGAGPVMSQIRKLAPWAVNHPGAALVSTDADGDVTKPVDGTHLDNPRLDDWVAHQFTAGWKVFLRVQVASREQEGEAQPPEPRKRSQGEQPNIDDDHDQQVTVWRGFSPLYVRRQLKLRGLADTNGGLVDLATGEILVAPDLVQQP